MLSLHKNYTSMPFPLYIYSFPFSDMDTVYFRALLMLDLTHDLLWADDKTQTEVSMYFAVCLPLESGALN